MAIERVQPDDDLAIAIARARRSIERPKPSGRLPEFSPEVKRALRAIIEDGTYARAVAAVSADDPDLADS